jgi:uncharacterized membrane protein
MFSVAGVEWPEIFSRIDPLMCSGFSLVLVAPPLSQLDRGFAPVTRLVALGIGLFGLLVLSTWGTSSLAPVNASTVEVIYQVVMLVVCIGLLVAAVRRGWNESVSLVSVALALFLLTRYFDWFWELMPRFLFFLILATLAFVWLWAMRRVRARLGAARR